MNKQKTVAESIPYEAPCMTTVPIRTSGAMLVGSGSPLTGGSPYGANPELIDFEAYNSSESEALRNGQFGDWSSEGNSFFDD